MLKASGKSNGQTGTEILLEAMSKDKVHLARFVLDALDGEIVDSRTESAQTPLISSVLLPDGRTRCKFAELLLQRGASVNRQDGTGRTALSYACEKGYLDAVKVLVRNNADPEIVDSWGNTALMYAAVEGHSPVVEFLVRAFKRLGLQIDRQNKVGNSAIEVAKFLGHAECISALTHNPKKSREADGGAQGNAQPRTSLEDEFERKVGNLVKKLEVLQTSHQPPCQPVQNWQSRRSMDSIEEFETENDGSSSPPQDQVLSGAHTPTPPARTYNHSPNYTYPKLTSEDHLPALIQNCEPQKSMFFSPQPSRTTSSSSSAPSALSVLLTPLLARKSDTELGAEKTKTPDFGVRTFHDSYYKKRCSLPTSMLNPTPPERALVPPRKSRTVRRREGVEPPHLSSPATTTFSVLSNKLLRRFTSPEFKKDAEESEQEARCIPRSETFPQSMRHPQVDSKPSVDSISSVKCEFDFSFRKANS